MHLYSSTSYKKRSVLLYALLCLALPAQAERHDYLRYDLTDPEIIATVNGDKFYTRSAKIMRTAINRGKRKLSLGQFIEGAIDNKLLADYGRQRVSMQDMVPQSGVGFDIDVALEDQFINVIRLSFDAPLMDYINQHFKHGNLMAAATAPMSLSRKQLKPYTVMKNPLKLGFTEAQIADAKQLELIRYRFPGQDKDHTITLWDIYRRQNVQGRDILHKADMRWLKTQVQQRLGSLLVLYWMEQHAGLSAEEIANIKQFIANKHYKKLYLTHQGLVTVLHKSNPRLRDVAKTISQKEVVAYYRDHREDFKRIDRARGRQIQTQTQDKIDQAYAALQGGADFTAVAEKYTELRDAQGKPQIAVDWIAHSDNHNTWLKTLLYLQPLGEPSRPYRSPQLQPDTPAYWTIIITDAREESYMAEDSPGVVYQISKILAEQKIASEFNQLRRQLLQDASIRINAGVLRNL